MKCSYNKIIYYTMIHSRNRMLGSILSKIYQSNKKELEQKILIPLEEAEVQTKSVN